MVRLELAMEQLTVVIILVRFELAMEFLTVVSIW